VDTAKAVWLTRRAVRWPLRQILRGGDGRHRGITRRRLCNFATKLGEVVGFQFFFSTVSAFKVLPLGLSLAVTPLQARVLNAGTVGAGGGGVSTTY